MVRDLLEKKISTFELEYIDDNIDIGDVLGLYDDYGTLYFTGVINEIDYDNNQITCDSNISYFEYNWFYNAYSEQTVSTEAIVKKAIEDTFVNSSDYLMREKYKNINISLASSSLTDKLPEKDEKTIESFRDFLYDCYSSFGIICDFKIFFEQRNPTLTIDSSSASLSPIKIGNNFNAIQNFTVDTDTFELNKLTIYSKDGTTLRGTYYGTQGGISTDDESPLRLKKINNEFVFTDDEIDSVVKQKLSETMYNHRITFDMILNNSLYSFFDLFKLGCPIEITYNSTFYDTIFTGYEMEKSQDSDFSSVRIVCGKLRNSLTSKLLNYVRS